MAATFLPAPRHNYQVHVDEGPPPALGADESSPRVHVPPYGQRQGFVPRAQADFGDGGAFPEIHVAQYPLEMGRPVKKAKPAEGGAAGGGGVGALSGLGNNSGSTAIVAVDVDEDGKVRGVGIGCEVVLARLILCAPCSERWGTARPPVPSCGVRLGARCPCKGCTVVSYSPVCTALSILQCAHETPRAHLLISTPGTAGSCLPTLRSTASSGRV